MQIFELFAAVRHLRGAAVHEIGTHCELGALVYVFAAMLEALVLEDKA